MGFEPMNCEVSNLKFDALDLSANLTFSLFFQANCVYGKTMQNVRDYLVVKLHTTAKSVEKAIAQPTFKGFTILSENLVQTNHYTPIIYHDKPIAIGVAILELVYIFLFCNQLLSIYLFKLIKILYYLIYFSEQANHVQFLVQQNDQGLPIYI